MDLSNFRRKLIVQHHQSPTDVRRIELAVAEISGALDTLASMGHMFHLEDGPEPARDEWPKLMFHASDSPNGRVVHSEAEALALGFGWHEDPAQAHQLRGLATQFAGRGGVTRMALPAVTSAPQNEEERIAERNKIRAEARTNLLNQRNQE